MIDVMLMLRVSKIPFVFVGKKELVKLPIFGYFYKRVAIMVDRDSAESRKNVYKLAQRRLDQGLGICIFPEGAVFGPDIKLAPFKNGVFRFSTDFHGFLVHAGGTRVQTLGEPSGRLWGNRSAGEPSGIPLTTVRTPSGKPGWG